MSAYADLKQEIAYRQAQQEWTKIVKKPLKDIKHCIQTWHAKSAKKKGSLLTLWARAAEKNVVSDDTLSYSATPASSNASTAVTQTTADLSSDARNNSSLASQSQDDDAQ